MSLIKFNYNKSLNYAIIYWVLELITRYLMYSHFELFTLVNNNYAVNEYIYLLLLNLSDLLSGFLVLYIQLSISGNNNNINNTFYKTKSFFLCNNFNMLIRLYKSFSFLYFLFNK